MRKRFLKKNLVVGIKLYDNKQLLFTSFLSLILLLVFRQGWSDWVVSIFAKLPLFAITLLGLMVYGIIKLSKDTALLTIVAYVSLYLGIVYFQMFERIKTSLFNLGLYHFIDHLIIISSFVLFIYNIWLIFKIVGIKKNQIYLLFNQQTILVVFSLFSIIILATFKNNWGKRIGIAFMYNRMPIYLLVMTLMIYSILYMKKYAVLTFILTYSIFFFTLFEELYNRLQNVFLFDFHLNSPIQYIKIVVSLLLCIYSVYLMIKIKKEKIN